MLRKHKLIDLETYPRREHFEYFRAYSYPYAGLVADVDVTALYERTKARSLPFFLSTLYCAGRAANAVPELRQRIYGDGIIEFGRCETSHVLLLDDGTFCYCQLENDMPYEEFIPYARGKEALHRATPTIKEDEEALSYFFVTCVPWVHFTALTQPVLCGNDSNPRISFGRFERREGRLMMPVSLLAHHALADGIHFGAFFSGLEEEIADAAK